MKRNPSPERFALVLETAPDPGGAPVTIRLRRLLKIAWRVFRLRCIRMKPLPPTKGT